MNKRSTMAFGVCGLALILMLSGCSGTKNGLARPGDTVTDLYPELVEGDLAMIGERFDLTRERAEDIRFENVLFEYDNFQIPSSEVPKIEKVAAYMRANPSLALVVEGHCDERGSREYNLALGEHRALSVRAYLVSLGIAPDRIQTVSYGEEVPVASGSNESAWRQNRRAEFVFYR